MASPAVADPNQGWVDVPETPPANADSGWVDVPETEEDKSQPKPQEKTPLGFGKNILTSGANLLTNVVKSIIPYDATNWNDAIPLKRASDSLFDMLWGTGRLAAKHLGVENMPMDPDSLKADQATQAFRDYVSSRYGSFDKFKDAWYRDPAGMAADLSTVLSGGAGAAKGLGLTGTAKALGKAAEISNPMFLPSKAIELPLGHVMPKKPLAAEGAPAFDPKTGTFTQPFDPFDPSTGSYKSPPPKPPDDPVARMQAQWGIKPPKSNVGAAPPPTQPKTPPQPVTPPAPLTPMQHMTNVLAPAVGGVVGHLLAHSLTGGLYGALTGAALKAIPAFLKSDMGQQMLTRIGPGSDLAAVAGVAKDMIPALNSFGRNYEESMKQHSVFDTQAKGGLVNPELARLQRERLRLPGIHQMLQQRK